VIALRSIQYLEGLSSVRWTILGLRHLLEYTKCQNTPEQEPNDQRYNDSPSPDCITHLRISHHIVRFAQCPVS
jgi:hypothetical protein